MRTIGGFKELRNIEVGIFAIWSLVVIVSLPSRISETKWWGERSESRNGVSLIREGAAIRGLSLWCFEFIKEVVGRRVAQDVSRTVVDLVFAFLKPFQRDSGEVRTLREILPYHPVVVRHSSLLPRAVRLTEVALASQQVIDKAMPRKLETVVIGNGFYVEIAQRRWYFSLIVSLL